MIIVVVIVVVVIVIVIVVITIITARTRRGIPPAQQLPDLCGQAARGAFVNDPSLVSASTMTIVIFAPRCWWLIYIIIHIAILATLVIIYNCRTNMDAFSCPMLAGNGVLYIVDSEATRYPDGDHDSSSSYLVMRRRTTSSTRKTMAGLTRSTFSTSSTSVTATWS